MSQSKEQKLREKNKEHREYIEDLLAELDNEKALHSTTQELLGQLAKRHKIAMELITALKAEKGLGGISEGDSLRVLSDLLRIQRTPTQALEFLTNEGFFIGQKEKTDTASEVGVDDATPDEEENISEGGLREDEEA